MRCAVVALAALFGARWFVRSRYLYEWDSAQYALGILRFDVRLHQPHPPGYPLWIALLKATHVVVRDLNAAQIALSLVVTIAATALFYRLARALYGAPAALLGASLLLFSPTVIFYDLVASTYPADLLTSTILGALSARLWRGDKRAGLWAVFWIALLAGVRQSGATMMAPLVAVSMLRAYRFEWRRWAIATAVGGATFAAWYMPTALMNGGIGAYQEFTRRTIVGYFHMTSVLFGAPDATHLAMLQANAIWACAAVTVAALATAAVWATGKIANPARTPGLDEPRLGAAFSLLWIVPNVLYVTLFHSVKPGYQVLDLPPLMLLAARVSASGLRRIDAARPGRARVVATAMALIAGVTTTALVTRRYGGAWDRMTLASVRDSDADTGAIERLVASGPGPAGTLVFVLGAGGYYGPNIRSLAVHLPDARVASLTGDGDHGLVRQYMHYAFTDDDSEAKIIAADVRRILWVQALNGGLPPSVRDTFPGTRTALRGRVTRVLESDIGESGVDGSVNLGGSLHFERPGPMPNPPAFECHMGSGFIDPVSARDPLWGVGPQSEFVVRTTEAAPIQLTLHVASAAPATEVSIHANGEAITAVRPVNGRDLVIEFPGVAGQNVVTLEYSRWNHHPDSFAPGDPRSFAVAFRSIRCTSGAETRVPFSL